MIEIKGKRLLVLGGTKIQCELIEAAKRMGVVTIVTDYNEPKDSPGKQICDESYMVSCTDVDAVVELIKDKDIDGVLVGFNDMLLTYYAEICKKAGLPCYATKSQFETFIDKSSYKALCREFEVPTVEEYVVDINNPMSTIDKIVFPVLVKPSDSSGSRGITVCSNKEELVEAIEYAKTYSAENKIIVERYLTGKEATVFWLFVDGEYYLTAIGNRHVRNDQKATIPLPVGYTFPAKITSSYMKDTCEKAKAMFNHAGIKNGMMFMQCKIENDKCVVYDIGYRLTGSLEYKVLKHICGFDPMEMLIRFSLTGTMDDKSRKYSIDPFLKNKYAFNVSILAKPGKIRSITGRKEALEIPGVIDVVTAHEEGEEITEDMAGLLSQITIRVLGVADSIDQTYQLMKNVYDTIDIISESGESQKLPGIELSDIVQELE